MKTHRTLFILLMAILFSRLFLAPEVLSSEVNQDRTPDIRSVEERRIQASIQEKRDQLAAKEAALQQKEIELKTLAAEVDKKLDELRRTGDEMQDLFDKVEEEEQMRIRKLSAMYEKMEPIQAARILVGLEEKLVIKILSNMKGKSGGRILANMDRDKAGRLTREFTQVVSNY